MRTTITLEPDVAMLLEAAMQRNRTTFKDAVNDAIRRGLSPSVRGGGVVGDAAAETPARYRVTPFTSELMPGYDLTGFNKLVDELEDEAILATLQKPNR